MASLFAFASGFQISPSKVSMVARAWKFTPSIKRAVR
jgi:hypothetical protein